jgi:catechol 2,3-dioxygenase-like lactoylglutathione lyase family enzyme
MQTDDSDNPLASVPLEPVQELKEAEPTPLTKPLSGNGTMHNDGTVSIRYIVDDVGEAIAFYQEFLGFELVMHPAPPFAILSLGNLRLLLSQPGSGGGGRAMLDGSSPKPGGWDRFQITVNDLRSSYKTLKEKGARFNSDIIEGIGGDQALLQDPSGNLVELFELKK